ncbi:MAG: hypothetical protein IJ741_02090 [Schwartzia sp.]|nr:hypothetical protein [Schwartzia sp. (in: firmicutes)]
MLYLNTRHTLPRIGIDMAISTLSSRIQKPTVDSAYHAPQSNTGMGRITMDINTYPSRKAYGARTMGDFTSEHGQQGISDIQSETSRHTQNAWAIIESGAKKGHNEIASQAKGRLSSEIGRTRYLEAQAIPDPEVQIHPADEPGDIDPGSWDYKINTADKADVTYNEGHFDVFLEERGSIHSWVSEGHYDIYA